jgi:hypothetical protein
MKIYNIEECIKISGIDLLLFQSMVVVAFQSTFHLEMYQINIFFIFKKLFLKSAHQNNLKIQKNINLK